MKRISSFQVKDVARLSGVSVRALHHYDEIGLLRPADRTPAGYRLYSQADLLRLQQILIGRALGLSLEEIRRSLDDPDFDQVATLRRQRARLLDRAAQTQAIIASIDAALEHIASKKEQTMDIKAIFEGFDPADHEDEVKARWGETEAYRESSRRTKGYGDADWRAIKAEQTAIWEAAAQAMKDRIAPDSDAAQAIVERHRRHIDRWFYPLSAAMHARLADMWETDARFAANIDRHGEGLTPWIAAAVRAAEA